MTSDPNSHPDPVRVDWSTPYGRSWVGESDTSGELHGHALRVGDDVWVIDPIDGPNLDEVLADLGGTVRHVVVALDRHQRDAHAFAERHGATLHVVAGDIRQQIPEHCERFDDHLEGSPFTVVPVIDKGKVWSERALWWDEHDLLVIPEALGSSAQFRTGTDNPVAVHPALRMTPPRAAFARATPSTILFGHGPAVTDGATEALQVALDESRSKAPQAAMGMAKAVIAKVRG